MTSDENWPEEPEGREPGAFDEVFIQKMKWLNGQMKATPWVNRNVSRERVYEAAKVATGARTIHAPDGTFRYAVCHQHTGRLVEFFGATMAEALERMGEAMEIELTTKEK